jgi:hypothetical protein
MSRTMITMVLWLIAGVLVFEPVPAQKETSEVLDR